jgi:HSP20 family molecular chaperone IbpA
VTGVLPRAAGAAAAVRTGPTGVKPEKCERWEGSFSRSLRLPAEVDVDKISATFKKGVLEVQIPKKAKPLGKKIEIRRA